MPRAIPLPNSYRDLASQVTHPGLYLDKFIESDKPGKWSEVVQRPAVDKVVRLSNTPSLPPPEYESLFDRWKATIGGSGFTGITAGPLTLHLARASALDNAGICFHRLYGFVYLPGTGLKGLARAFAETVWLEADPDKLAAWQKIEAVFGWAPGSNLVQRNNKSVPKPWMPDGGEDYRKGDSTSGRKARPASAGAAVFHDAWPEHWPRLVTDILNSHHKSYYEGKGPPGDWDDPVPVYFLSVEPGTKFRFPVAKRRDDVPDELLTLARQWLIGGLTQLGAGAKTAGGYGDFIVEEPKVVPVKSPRRATFEATLKLVTPAFLAGAKQQAEDCDLRPSTLRGQLRWWWRTLHAGFVSVEDLRKMEAAIWGDTKTGGAVRVTVRKVKSDPPMLYSHPTQQPSGTHYAAYGMDEQVKVEGIKTRKQRQVLHAGATWEVRLAARVPRGRRETAADVLSQATVALWLLTHFGGVGSKSRKGFGSLHATPLDGHTWHGARDEYVALAAAFRRTSGVPDHPQFAPTLADPGSVVDPDIQTDEIDAGRVNPWQLMDRIGAAYSAVCATFKHEEMKAALGLPRKIHGPRDDGPLRHQNTGTWQQPQSLASPIWPPGTRPDKGRHASPIHLHVGMGADGGLVVRLLTLPAQHLRSRDESVAMLQQFARGFRMEFETIGRATALSGPRPSGALPPGPSKRQSGTPVQVNILGKRAKGGFDVQEVGRNPGTLTVGTQTPGVDTGDGKPVTVWVLDDKPDKPQYKWPDPPKGGKK